MKKNIFLYVFCLVGNNRSRNINRLQRNRNVFVKKCGEYFVYLHNFSNLKRFFLCVNGNSCELDGCRNVIVIEKEKLTENKL